MHRMYTCKFCGKEIRSSGGLTMHERACASRNKAAETAKAPKQPRKPPPLEEFRTMPDSLQLPSVTAPDPFELENVQVRTTVSAVRDLLMLATKMLSNLETR